MKKSLTFSLIPLMLVVFVGNLLPLLFHKIQLDRLHRERFEQRHFHPIISGMKMNVTQYRELDWEIPGKEFVLNHAKYDIISTETDYSGNIKLTCSKDAPETEQEDNWQAAQDVKKKPGYLQQNIYWPVWFPLQTSAFQQQECVVAVFHSFIYACYETPALYIISPPPEARINLL